MEIWQMRNWLLQQYPGVRWHERVSRMAPNQVIAIYRSMRNRPKKKEPVKTDGYHQIDMFEWLAEKEVSERDRTEV